MLRHCMRGAREGRYDAPRHVGRESSRCVENCEIGNFGRASQSQRDLLLGPVRLIGGSSPEYVARPGADRVAPGAGQASERWPRQDGYVRVPCITMRILPLQHAEAQHLREVSRGEGGAAVARAARELHGSKVGQLVRR